MDMRQLPVGSSARLATVTEALGCANHLGAQRYSIEAAFYGLSRAYPDYGLSGKNGSVGLRYAK
jgi:hypothetical protein